MRLLRTATVLPLLLLLLAAPVLGQVARTVSKTVPLDAEGRVSIDTHKGSITVTTWDRTEAVAEVRVEGDEDYAEAVKATEILFQSDRQHLRLKTDYDAVQNRRGLFDLISMNNLELPATHYTLKLPHGAQLHIDDHKSDIRVTGLRGGLSIDTHKGCMTIEDVAGGLTLDTHKGEADIRGLDGALRLDTHKGTVRVAFERFDGAEVDTHKGRIDLTLPRHAGFELEAELDDRGTLDTDFDLQPLRRGDDDKQQYQGAVNGGGPRLALETHKGDFSVRMR